MVNDFETSINNSRVCEVSNLLQMEVENGLIPTYEDPRIENVNDGHVNDHI